MNSIQIECPACRGSGTQMNRHVSGDPQLETVGECQAIGCEGGLITVTDEQVQEAVMALLFTVSGGVPGMLTDGMARRGRKALRDMGIDA